MVEARLNPRQSGSSARDFAHRGRLPLSEGSRPFEQRQSDLERKGSVWEDLAVLLDGGMCCVKVKQRLKGAMYMELVTIPSSNQCSLSFYLAPGTPMGTGRHSHKPVFQKQHENKQIGLGHTQITFNILQFFWKNKTLWKPIIHVKLKSAMETIANNEWQHEIK